MDVTTPAVVAPVVTAKVIPFATLDQYKQAIADAGLSYTEQSGFLRVDGASGRRLYVASTKTVRRIDISGWEFALGRLTKPPHTTITGNVKQQMVIGLGADADLEKFTELLAHMKSLAAVEKVAKPKAPKAAKAGDADGEVPSMPASSPNEAIEKRLAQIANVKKFAEMRGSPVSEKVLAEEVSLLAQLTPAPTQAQAEAAE